MWTIVIRDKRLDFHGNPDHHLESSMLLGGGCNLRVFLFKLKHAVVYADDMYLSYKTKKNMATAAGVIFRRRISNKGELKEI